MSRYLWLNSCTGIELQVLADNNISCRACTISLQKDTLTIEKQFEESGDLEIIFKKVSTTNPISISFTGKGLLTKKTNRDENLSHEKLSQLFPNIKPDQFYIQNFIGGDCSFITIVRKEIIDKFLFQIQKFCPNILSVSFGPFLSSHILKQLNSYGQFTRFDGHNISLNEAGDWEDYRHLAGERSEFPMKVGITPIKESCLLAYSAAFQLALYPKLNAVTAAVELATNNLENFRQKQTFNFRLAIMMGTFFTLLLINFLLFTYYNSKNSELIHIIDENSASIESYQHTEKDIIDSELYLKELGWYKGIGHAWLADQLGQSIPLGLSIKEILINPLDVSASNKSRQELFKIGTIEILGETNELTLVNEWIYILKSKSWLRNVNLNSYSPSTENEKQAFAITINY
ncbi:MAG TPA: hypothetical protein VGB63_15755 [Pedobacter sp.]